MDFGIQGILGIMRYIKGFLVIRRVIRRDIKKCLGETSNLRHSGRAIVARAIVGRTHIFNNWRGNMPFINGAEQCARN